MLGILSGMPAPTRGQQVVVAAAFVLAALSLATVAAIFANRGEIATVPLLGGLLMLVLAISGTARLKRGR